MEKGIIVKDIDLLRKNMYRFLARIYMLEVDESLLNGLKAMEFPRDTEEERMNRGYERMRNYIRSHGPGDLEELAVDYADTFLAAGVAEGRAAFPYGSVYMSRKNLIGQEPCSQVTKEFIQGGVEVSSKIPKIPDDHIAAIMEFMADLIEKGEVHRQEGFFTDHLYSWGILFAADVEKYATTDFYKGLGDVTAGFLALEKEYLQQKGGAV